MPQSVVVHVHVIQLLARSLGDVMMLIELIVMEYPLVFIDRYFVHHCIALTRVADRVCPVVALI